MSATLSTPKTTSGGEIIRELVNASDGQGLHFAAGGCINLANSAGGEFGLADFSIEFILDQDGDNVSNNYIWESHNAGNNRVRVWNELSSNVVTVRFVNSAGANTTFTLGYDMSADYGKPTHYAITCDRDGNATLYKNGNNVASVSISSTAAFDLGDSNTTTGIISNSSNNYSMLGTFYRFRTWNKSLSQAEVTDSYSNATVPFSDQYGSQTSLVDAAASVFTSGTYSWVAFGSNTVTNVSNTLAITYTGGSPRMEGAYNYLKETGYDLTTNLTVGKKYRVTFDAKYTGGSAGVKLRIFNITDNIDSDALTTSLVTYNLEFTANSATGCYLYLTGLAASNVVTIDNWYVREIGCVSDYDLAFANQKQSLVVEDRSGSKTDAPAGVNATGMMSASGVTQVTPIEQLNSKSARIGTSAATPADNQLVVGAGTPPFTNDVTISAASPTVGLYTTSTHADSRNWAIRSYHTNPGDLVFSTSSTKGGNPTGAPPLARLTIDSAGEVNINDGTNRALGPAGASNLQISGTGAMQLGMLRSEASAGGPHINLTKSRGAAPGTFAIVQDGDSLGKLSFGADDGADYASLGAYIEGKVAGTPGANDMPGSLVLATTADGATDPTPRLTIDSAGTVSTSSTAAETLSINSSAGQGSFQAWKNSTTSVFLIGNRNAVSGTQATNGDGTDLWATTGRGIAFYTNDSTAARLNISSAGAVTMPSTPAFSATPSAAQDNLAVAPAVVDIVLGTEIFDQGANFASNTFTAPVAGRYQLNAILGLVYIDSAADFYQIQIATSNRTYTYTFDPDFGQDAVYWEFGPSVLADMDASDTAVMRFFQSGGTAQTDVATVRTFFNGYLAC